MVIAALGLPSYPKTHEEALNVASLMLLDEVLSDIEHAYFMGDDWNISESTFIERLPGSRRHFYSVRILQRFLFVVSTVAWKLAQRDAFQLSCVAEELALSMIIEDAEGLLENYGIEADFEDFWETAFEDHDFKFLYAPEYDGIEDSPYGAWAGIGHLRFAEWFDEFGEGSRGQVHPYAVDADVPNWMTDRQD